MLLTSYSLLEENRKNIDALNVFPVPDGDTGTNMCLTFKSAINEMNLCENNSLEPLCVAFNRGALKGARGNSGVILSQIIKGMCSVLMSLQEITPRDFSKAIQMGSDVAYKAVTAPKEGTILTIIKSMADEAKSAHRGAKSFDEYLSKVIIKAEETLQRTPEMLPVLKKAGVVDAGGRGLVVIFSGMYKMLTGEMVDVEFVDTVTKDVTSEENHVNYKDLADIQFGYCTEFFVINIFEKTTEADINTLRSRLLEIGDSVLCIGDLQLIKVHVHTNEPNRALGYALQMGELSGVKIENMLQQNRELKNKQQAEETLKEYGIIAVASGEGLSNIFKDLEVDYIISGGQTMNPSANDIATAADKVKAKHIFVLPNNKNIILAAEQADDITNKSLIVIPTKSIPEGISAVLAFDSGESLEENKNKMIKAAGNVKSGAVTYAVRTTNIDGFELNMGEIIGLNNKNILAKGSDINETTKDLIEKMYFDEMMNLTIFYGNEISSEQAEQLQDELDQKYPNIDVSVVFGGQQVYYYILSLE